MKTNRLHALSARIDACLHQFEAIPLKDETSSDYGCISNSGPTLYVSGRKDSKVFDIPKEGTAKVAYRVRSKSVSYREDGTERYSTDIEVHSIDPTNLEAVLKRYDFGDRARDTGGRYASGVEVSADDMADAYGKPKRKKAALLIGAGAATAAAAGLSPAVRNGLGRGAGRLVRSAMA